MSVSNHDVKILLCGFYLQGNTGDDLLMESIVETLSRQGEVKVTSTETFDIELLNWCQILVIGAGSLITPRGIGGYRHAKYAKENGKKVVYYSQTIEEGHPKFREHLARADLITVRDSESKRVAEANGFRAVLASDPIFKAKKRTIGFSFRRWVNEPPDIVERLASMLDNLAVDYEIFSLPYTENDTDTESDASFHEQVIRHMKNKPKQAAYDDAIQRVDLFMGMRLHALINGINMGKRVLAVDYDTKVGRIFSDLAKNDAVVSYNDLEKIPYLVRNEIFGIDKLALREKVNEALVARICSDIRGEPGVKVSIVMPTYNRANYLKEAIDSILTQTLQDWELIIIDGGSTDNTKELVESYREGRIRYYNFGNNGISYSRNIGNLLSRGEIIAVADSDDINLPNRLEVTCKEMEKSKADIIYSSMFHFDDTRKKELIPSHPFSYERLKEGNFIYHPTIAYRRDVAMICPYNEDLEMVEDYHLYLQAAEKGYKFHQLEDPLVMHRLHEEQISSVRGEEMAEIHRRLVDSASGKMKDNPLVSVIVPTFNRPDMLKEALMSILSQTYQNFEIIVVNDAGEDVKDVIDSLNEEGKLIYLQHKENRGLPAARNTGLKAAKGKYIAYLDDDDIYYPNHLETLVSFLENSDYKVAYTDSYYTFQEWITDRYVTVGKKIIHSLDFDRQKLLIFNYIPVLNVVHKKDIIEVAGLFDEALDAHEDWDMWIRLSQYGDFHHINMPTTEISFRTDRTTMTSRNRMPFLKTMEIIHKRYSHLVTNPSIFEEQKKAEGGLAREVEIKIKDSIIPHYEYLHRYRFAKEFVRGKKVLNLACGEGYGSFLLSEEADSVVGIDIDGVAISHARSKHIKENLEFIKGSITDVPIEGDKKFDLIVCFEAIEHIKKYDQLMIEVKRLLRPDGIFIASISNKYLYSDVDDYGPPFHAKKLYLDNFKKLLSDHFKNILLYGQKVYPTSNIFPLYKGAGYSQDFVMEKGDEKYLFGPLEKRLASYFIAVASDNIIDKNVVLGNSHLLDLSETLFRQKNTSISLLERMVREKDIHISNLEGMVREKDIHISNFEGIAREKGEEIGSLRTGLAEKERELSQRDSKVSKLIGAISEKEAHISTLEGIVREGEAAIGSIRTGLAEKEAALNHIYNSHGWKALLIYYRLRNKILPVNSRRRKTAKFVWNFFNKINLKSISFFLTKKNIRRANSYIENYGVRAFAKKVWWKLNSEKVNTFHKPEIPKFNLSAIKEDEIVPYEDATVSIVIPVFNEAKNLEVLLPFLRCQKGLKNIQMILVDSGSTDESIAIAKNEGAKIVNIPNERFSHDYARNLGAEHSSGRYLLFLTADALPTSDTWLYEMVHALKNTNTVALSCVECPRMDADLFWRVNLWNHNKFLEVDEGDRILSMPEVANYANLRKNAQLANVACLIDRDIFLKYKFRTQYAEDLDLGVRLIKDGYKLALLSSTMVIHSHNRPAYHHLKRGYVDSLILPQILPDFPLSFIQANDLIRDIVFTYDVLNSLVTNKLDDIGTPCNIEKLNGVVVSELKSMDNQVYPLSIKFIDNNYTDKEFRLFAQKIYESYSKTQHNQQYNGCLIGAMLNYLGQITYEYMTNTYESIDNGVLEDYKSLIFKAFAFQVGAHFAGSYLRSSSSEKAKLQDFHNELSDVKILWEEKHNIY